MRHGVRELPRHAGRGRHRVLYRRGDPPHAVIRAPGTIARDLTPTGSRPLRLSSARFEPTLGLFARCDNFASREGPMSRSLSKLHAPSHRTERVGELIRHAVADILARGEVVDEALDRHPLTIRAVRMS